MNGCPCASRCGSRAGPGWGGVASARPRGLRAPSRASCLAVARYHRRMQNEKIKIRTENGQVLEVVVYDKRPDRITVVLGEGVHSVKCDLHPTRNALAYAGSVMGREIIYERSRDQVQADIDRLNPNVRGSHRR